MQEILPFLNQPAVLWTLFTGAILAVLVDYLFPVDWLAYVGYLLFAIFVGATIATSPAMSLIAGLAVLVMMLLLHHVLFSKYLTNAPRHERRPVPPDDTRRL